MVQWVTALPGSRDENRQVFLHPILADQIGQGTGTQGKVEMVFSLMFWVDQARGFIIYLHDYNLNRIRTIIPSYYPGATIHVQPLPIHPPAGRAQTVIAA